MNIEVVIIIKFYVFNNFWIKWLIFNNKHLMTGPEGNGENLNVSRDEVEG